ncbi:hypothetical protein GCM10010215_39930 [Streptomyces virginiae]|uniref:Integrase n=1 Tax=Streptomyces virginiae TaxID=1961 RepID=A0ABQ3NZJ2_STRVG|nr:hypothetical protein [Streptomyces virginiae]MBP2343796.1 hypothetical protein [Streptomyces virginiae]GGQ10907.1 hypothetical protein GCM10010215_39930 [Streptomyces virginiae]GHI18188.1 hypothetical protein Scinn_76510 [Streptomyces virginiae]
MAWHYATAALAKRARTATAQIAIHTRMGNEEAHREARAEMAAVRLESAIRSEAGYLDEDRLNRLADLMFEVEPE